MANLIFIGTKNRGLSGPERGPGLAVYGLDEPTLTTTKLAEATDTDDPTFLSVTRDGSRIYANSEVAAGTVSAYSFDRAASSLARINKHTTLGNGPVHNTITRDGTKLLVVNYGDKAAGGPDKAVAVFGIGADGALTPALDSASQSGHGPDPRRQDRSHPHSVNETIAGNVAIVANLGTDHLVSYRIGEDGKLTLFSDFVLAGGSGPRHLAMHPSGRFVFVANELDATVVSLALDSQTGRLDLIDTKPGAPGGHQNFPGDVVLSPDGRFLYLSNRSHDSNIGVFAVNEDSGKLGILEHTPCGGSWPRNIALTPSAEHLFVANEKSNRVAILSRDAASGKLTDTGKSIQIGTPKCVRIVL